MAMKPPKLQPQIPSRCIPSRSSGSPAGMAEPDPCLVSADTRVPSSAVGSMDFKDYEDVPSTSSGSDGDRASCIQVPPAGWEQTSLGKAILQIEENDPGRIDKRVQGIVLNSKVIAAVKANRWRPTSSFQHSCPSFADGIRYANAVAERTGDYSQSQIEKAFVDGHGQETRGALLRLARSNGIDLYRNADQRDGSRQINGLNGPVLPSEIRQLGEKWVASAPLQRVELAKTLGSMGDVALPLLSYGANDPDRDVRCAVARALGEVGEHGLPYLVEMARDERVYVRDAVAQALGASGGREIETLKRLSRDENLMVRRSAYRSMEAMSEAALPYAGNYFIDDPEIRDSMLKVMRNAGESALPLVQSLARNRANAARQLALQAFAFLPHTDQDAVLHVPQILKIVERSDAHVFDGVKEALVHQGHALDAHFLEGLRGHRNADVRAAANELIENASS